MKRLLSVALAVLFCAGGILFAGDRTVSLDELKNLAVAASEARGSDRTTLQQFFSSEAAQRALKQARIDPGQVVRAVATLSDEDASRLAARAAAVQRDFSAGALNTQQLTYIAIALGTAVIILIIVVAAD